MIKKIVNDVTIPVMAKARIGHIVEAQVIQTFVIFSFPDHNVQLDSAIYWSRLHR